MHQLSISSLVPIMVCHMYGAKPVLELMLAYCKLALKNKPQWNCDKKTAVLTH